MKKQTLITIWLLMTTSLLLAGCWDKTTKTDDKPKQTQQQNINNSKKTQKVIETINDRMKKQATALWLDADKLDVKKFRIAYDVWSKCQRRFCKNEYEKIKKDKIILDYFNKIVWKYHIPKNATKYVSPKDIVEAETKNGYTSLASCNLWYKKQYKTLNDCIKDNYKNFKNLSEDKKKGIEDFLKNWLKYNISFADYLNVKRTCEWWASKQFKIGKELQADLDKEKEQWFNATNFFKETYIWFLKDKMTPQQYFSMMKAICWYDKFIKEQKNRPQQWTQAPR